MNTNRPLARFFSPILMVWVMAEIVLVFWPSMSHAQSTPELPSSKALYRLAQQFYDAQVSMGLMDTTTRSSAYRSNDTVFLSARPNDRTASFALQRGLLAKVKALPETRLSAKEKFNRDLLIRELDISLGYKRFAQRRPGFGSIGTLPVLLADAPAAARRYKQSIRAIAGTALDPDDIHRSGLAEVARNQHMLAQEAARFGFNGAPEHALAWLTANTPPSFATEDQVLAAYRAMNDKVLAAMAPLFPVTAVEILEIAPIQTGPGAYQIDHATLATEEGGRPGIYWVAHEFSPDNSARRYDTDGIAARLLRAGRPGHYHLTQVQGALDLPLFRQHGNFAAFRQGWGLYAASLGHEMGMYPGSGARVAEWRLELLAASALVIDTGIHTRGWTARQATGYLMANAGLSHARARHYVGLCVARPAQALAEGLGFLAIRRLRARATQGLGAAFSLAVFHEVVLREGALPLDFLEREVERWIASTPGASARDSR